MCNLYQLEKSVDAVRRLFAELQIPLAFPEGIPNLEPRNVRITERAPIVRWSRDKGTAELVVARTDGQAGIQHALRRARIRQRPLPGAGGRLLRVHDARGPEAEEKELLAVQARYRVRYRRDHARRREGRRGLYAADGATWQGHRALSQSPDRLANAPAVEILARSFDEVCRYVGAERPRHPRRFGGSLVMDQDVILKRFETPDEVREFELGKFEIVHIHGMPFGRAT